MGGPSVSYKTKVAVLGFWNRLVKMPNTRLTKKIFLHDKTFNTCTWSSQVLKILKKIYGEQSQFDHFMGGIDLIEAKSLPVTQDKEKMEYRGEKILKTPHIRNLKKQFWKRMLRRQFSL